MFVTSVSGSNKSKLCKTSNKNIANLVRIHNQKVAIFEDPKIFLKRAYIKRLWLGRMAHMSLKLKI